MPSERPSGNLGKKLREAREHRGVSLRQIADSTKIAVSILDALERNDISRLPGGIFGRAFVRSFASEVGLDPEATIQEFIAQFPQDSVTVGHPPSERTGDDGALESDRRTASTFLRLIALSIPIAAVVVYFSTTGRRAAVALEQAATAADVRSIAEAADGLGFTVDLAVSRPCRVSATVDDDKQAEWALQAGDRRTFRVLRELVLTARDAGAVEMMVNGAVAKPLGRSGEVATVRLSPGNYRQYLLTP
jgi:transcriptional regulator with XRE-family HTH domain